MKYAVQGFAGSRHPKEIPFGTLLVATTNDSEGSVIAEIGAWMLRMRDQPGSVSRVEVTETEFPHRQWTFDHFIEDKELIRILREKLDARRR